MEGTQEQCKGIHFCMQPHSLVEPRNTFLWLCPALFGCEKLTRPRSRYAVDRCMWTDPKHATRRWKTALRARNLINTTNTLTSTIIIPASLSCCLAVREALPEHNTSLHVHVHVCREETFTSLHFTTAIIICECVFNQVVSGYECNTDNEGESEI